MTNFLLVLLFSVRSTFTFQPHGQVLTFSLIVPLNQLTDCFQVDDDTFLNVERLSELLKSSKLDNVVSLNFAVCV